MTDAPNQGGRCPICGKPRDARFRPFCSRQCRDRDFLAWADGRYAIPVLPEPDEEEPAVSPPRRGDEDGE